MSLPGDTAWTSFHGENPEAEAHRAFAAGWDARRRFDGDRRTLLLKLAYELETHGGKYTRAFGREDNAARVLMLTDDDVYHLGLRLRAIAESGEDPGDPRYICLTAGCTRSQHHSGDHDPKELEGIS